MDVSAPFSSHNKVPFVSEAPMRGETKSREKGFIKITLKDKRDTEIVFYSTAIGEC